MFKYKSGNQVISKFFFLYLVIHHALVSNQLTVSDSQLNVTAHCGNEDLQLTVAVCTKLYLLKD